MSTSNPTPASKAKTKKKPTPPRNVVLNLTPDEAFALEELIENRVQIGQGYVRVAPLNPYNRRFYAPVLDKLQRLTAKLNLPSHE